MNGALKFIWFCLVFAVDILVTIGCTDTKQKLGKDTPGTIKATFIVNSIKVVLGAIIIFSLLWEGWMGI